nr:hypothetical protein [uncultured Methanoregula sp.]
MSRRLQSPPFRYLIGAGSLAANGVFTPGSLETTDKQVFVPFNTLTIKNLSSNLLEVTYLNDLATLVPAGTVVEIQEPGIVTFSIKNLDATTANDKQIEIIIQRVVRPEHIMLAQLYGAKLCQVLDGEALTGGGC